MLVKFIKVCLVFIVGLNSISAAAGPKSISSKLNNKLQFVSGNGTGTLGQTVNKFDVTVVQFWASWCVGCGEMMGELAKRSKADSSIGYASISIDEDLATAQRYFKAKPDYVRAAIPNALLDEGGENIATPLKINSLPYVIIVSKDGRVNEAIAGHPKPEELTKMIERARESKPSPAKGAAK
jgi:thioredoxin-like negative regulator of GroEL